MGILDYVSDLYAALAIQTAEAEQQQDEGKDENESGDGEDGESKSEESEGGEGEGDGEESSEGGDEGGDEEEEGGDDEEEEEEEEIEDIKPKLEEQCLKSQQCSSLKHHYDECAERVQQQIDEDGKAKEDCVEEFFHMMHCATQCAAPKLFKQLR